MKLTGRTVLKINCFLCCHSIIIMHMFNSEQHPAANSPSLKLIEQTVLEKSFLVVPIGGAMTMCVSELHKIRHCTLSGSQPAPKVEVDQTNGSRETAFCVASRWRYDYACDGFAQNLALHSMVPPAACSFHSNGPFLFFYIPIVPRKFWIKQRCRVATEWTVCDVL